MLFRDVIGQEVVKQQLVEMVQHNRLSHALLFLAKEGAGGLPLAMAFSTYVSLLPNRNETPVSLFGEPAEIKLPATPDEADAWMEKQPSFAKASQLVHPDIHFSYPVVPRKASSPSLSSDYAADWREFVRQFPYGNVFDWLQFIGAENKQGNITAAECYDIIRKLSLKSFESGYKILIIWMPEYLKKEGNRLLKLIEEPPPDTLFILVAENQEQILPTILSRCQLVKVPGLESTAIERQLVAHSSADPAQAKLLANASEGSYREALHLLNHADEDFLSILRDWLNACVRNQSVQLLKIIDVINSLGREKQKQLLRHFSHLVEWAVRVEILSAGGSQQILDKGSSAENEFAAKINKVMTIGQKEAIADELNEAAYHIERNVNARILFHALSIRMYHIIRNNVTMKV